MPVGIVCYIVFSVILGIFLGVRLFFVQMSVAVDNVGFGEAFSRSWNMTKGNSWAIIMLFIVSLGIYILGSLACCVGVLFSSVIVNFMFVLAYFELKGDDQLEDMEEVAEMVEP
jgi:membrane-anchored glycerophosphoryl diester phosphodiesterase (GDPDase)